jgi:tetratricopeptide (TPR) repeat protein
LFRQRASLPVEAGDHAVHRTVGHLVNRLIPGRLIVHRLILGQLTKTLAIVLLFIFIVIFVAPADCLAQSTAAAETSAKQDPEWHHADELYNQGKVVEAMPLFEGLSARYPSDPAVRERWAWCLMDYAVTLTDPEQRKKVRVRARTVAQEAKRLGDNSQLLEVVLEIPEDGAEAKFSSRQDVDEAMKTAEADYVRGDFDKARAGYLRVMLVDPDNYEAALFTGDVFFKQHVYGSAGEWFARAIQIDANRETAYRYWGDALAAVGKEDEARSKFIDGIVADPYNKRSWVGLQNWLKRNKVELNNVKLKDLSSVEVKDEKNVNITLDNSIGKNNPDAEAWMSYGLDRAAWHTEKSEKEFPGIPRDRHTLQEETHALNFMITVLKEEKDHLQKLPKLDPSLQALIKIQELGFLDPFVLLNRADPGIAQDYPTYRAANRGKIRSYLDEYMVPKTPAVAK